MDGEKACQFIEESFNEIAEFKQMWEKVKDLGFENIIKSINGDMAMGFTDVVANIPLFRLYAETNDPAALDFLYQHKEEFFGQMGNITTLKPHEYVCKLGILNIYFGVKDNTMYLTNDEDAYNNFEKTVTPNINEAPYASEIKGKDSFAVINIETLLNIPAVKMLTGIGGNEAQLYLKLASNISNFTIYSENQKATFELNLKDKDTNALKQVVDLATLFITSYFYVK